MVKYEASHDLNIAIFDKTIYEIIIKIEFIGYLFVCVSPFLQHLYNGEQEYLLQKR